MTPSRRAVLLATAGLVAVTAVWGLTFSVVKEAIETIPPFQFLAIRFAIAAAALALAFPKTAAGLRGPVFAQGALAGAALSAGYALQTVGLQFTEATKAGFITGLFVVFTPVVAALALRRAPARLEAGGVALAAGGLLLLTSGGRAAFSRGDFLVLGCAAAFACHIVILGRYAASHDPRALALVQMGVAAVVFTAAALVTGRAAAPAGASIWYALLLTGLAASAAGYLVQTWAQRHLSPTRCAVTLTMEPVFAGVFGAVLLGERLPPLGWLGAALILAAMLLVDVLPAEA